MLWQSWPNEVSDKFHFLAVASPDACVDVGLTLLKSGRDHNKTMEFCQRTYRVMGTSRILVSLRLCGFGKDVNCTNHDNTTTVFKAQFPHDVDSQHWRLSLQVTDDWLWSRSISVLNVQHVSGFESWQRSFPPEWHFPTVADSEYIHRMIGKKITPMKSPSTIRDVFRRSVSYPRRMLGTISTRQCRGEQSTETVSPLEWTLDFQDFLPSFWAHTNFTVLLLRKHQLNCPTNSLFSLTKHNEF